MTLISDRQSESDLDSVRNSCDVFDSLLWMNLFEDYIFTIKETSGAHPKIRY